MNFLAHHAVARAAWSDGAPTRYVGNLLPDLMSRGSGGARIRPVHVERFGDRELAAGIELHLLSDQQFHSAPEFAALTREASLLFRETGFGVAPTRVFFLAHAFVEIALDGVLIEDRPMLVDDLYRQFDAAPLPSIAEDVAATVERPLPRLLPMLTRFRDARYLYEYGTPAGLAEALHRIALRVGLAGFADTADRAMLAGLFVGFSPTVRKAAPILCAAPRGATRSGIGVVK